MVICRSQSTILGLPTKPSTKIQVSDIDSCSEDSPVKANVVKADHDTHFSQYKSNHFTSWQCGRHYQRLTLSFHIVQQMTSSKLKFWCSQHSDQCSKFKSLIGHLAHANMIFQQGHTFLRYLYITLKILETSIKGYSVGHSPVSTNKKTLHIFLYKNT